LDIKNTQHKFKKLFYEWIQTDSIISNSLAVIIGLLTGAAIVIYDIAIEYSNIAFFDNAAGQSKYLVIIVPAIGGLLVGILFHISKSTRRYDIAHVIEATTLHGGRISARNAFLEVLASVISIGSGGSVGKEAPVVLAGAGIGSSVARLLKIHGNRIKILLACGASGGIAAAFNAPLAGVVFAVEVILGELEAKTFIPIVISAVFATLISNVVFGVRVIEVTNYELVSPFYESLLYLGLGTLAGVISVILMRVLYATHDFFENFKVHPIIKPAIGGLLVGLIGFYYPQIFGVGYHIINDALSNNLPLKVMLILIVLKIFAFSFTVGSGGSGGSIVPAMFTGAMLGGAYGTIMHGAAPAITAESGAYALAGMGAMLAGTSHAPLAAILILFEITRDYNLILPIMLACVASSVVSRSLNPESIFTEGLKKRGFVIRKGQEVDIMESVLVGDAMRTNIQTVSENKNVRSLIALMQTSRHAGFPVLDSNGKLHGIVTLKDLRDKVEHDQLEKTIGEIATTDIEVAYPDETLNTVLKRLAVRDIGRLPVVSRSDDKQLIGIITRSDIVKLYDKKVLDKVQKNKNND
jgi:CIC family chloride channel protein